MSVVDMSEPKEKAAKMATELDQLKDYTVVVADTGDFEGEFHYRAWPRSGLFAINGII